MIRSGQSREITVQHPKLLSCAMLLVIGATLPARAEMASAAGLANSCFSCHGTDGKSAGAMPTIAGKSAAYMVEKLTSFKSGALDSTVMGRIAKGFSDAEIDALAKFFSGQ